jgi:biofilm protein TabA
MAIIGMLAEILKRHAGDEAIATGLKYLQTLGEKPLPTKPEEEAIRIEIKGDKIFALHQSYTTKAITEGRFEAHKRFIDLQYIIKGTELIRIAPLKEGQITLPYNKEKDIEFYQLHEGTNLLMKPGMVAILYPDDLHAPCLTKDKPALVHKVVIKVEL